MNERVSVRPVLSRRDQRRFQRLPWDIYAPPGVGRDPAWVPPILMHERDMLGWRGRWGGRHPFYDHAESVSLIAERGGRVVGRVVMLVNRVHNEKYAERRGFFGFFECRDDPDVATGLLECGEAWLRDRGMTTVRGPVNPSLNYTCGMLVEGFEHRPRFLMTYNPAHYPKLLEGCGYLKSQDLYAYEIDQELLAKLVVRYKRAVLAALEGSELVLRPLDAARAQQDLAVYMDIYNRSLDGTWGFTPLQPREVERIASEMRHVIVPELAIFAEVRGEPIGALLALLDYNQILGACNGRLFPVAFLRLLRGRRRITTVRAMAMTMVPGYDNAGLSVVLLDRLVDAAARWGAGIELYEFSWVLESNGRSRGTLERAGAKRTRTYRLYDKML